MSSTFTFDNLPFSLLEEAEREHLLRHLDIAYYQKGETILAAGDVPEGVYIILKGRVSENDVREADRAEAPQQPYVHYEDEDYFGGWSALRGRAIHNFVAEEETICHVLPTATLLELVAGNPSFADYFQQNLAAKSEIVAQHGQDQDIAEFMLARVDSGLVQQPLNVLEGTSIRQATELMREQMADCVLVRKGNRHGMITKTDLLEALVLKGLPQETDIAEIASFRLITISPEDYLFNALVLMTRQHIERLVVMRGEELVGIVSLTDILSFFSSHSHVIGLRIERAQTVEDLRQAARGLNDLIRSLVSHGVKVRFIMDLLSAMNGRVMAKLFDLMVPPDMQPHVCLIVMGSEGRGEQILKTDQDNAIIHRDGLSWPGMAEMLERFSERLIEFGYPPCPGHIMVSNPEWVNSLGDWTTRLGDWADSCEGEAVMRLAIAVDAKPVAGNPALFKAARNWFLRHLRNNDVFFSHFARAALEFDTPLTFFGNLRDKSQLDIKKGGIFPIVHGVRTMALEQRILATNTFTRIDQLVEGGLLQAEQGGELAEALGWFVQLRLRHQIRRLESSEKDPTPNLVDLKTLNKMERELLRDALHVVKGFKRHLAQRYHLEV
ncbi:cyclic nucleotide-binding protein [Marinobacterium nitratireducens]|uniref:Cyclic nucleotide-binding protein n=1 Tax=Marinobacterium nitratireducens TaxID=518897 RepID=A0A917ZLV4_9GAMM|nr:putative nucleotidyltransferase substrate binding domain-containing protein [Marinobacterium nitratireducens]GGO84968.1 cyclic nucleotide-binding protein [Marinobacterium nitratireducens]